LAAPTSTISIASARVYKVYVQAEPSTGPTRNNSACSTCAARRATWCRSTPSCRRGRRPAPEFTNRFNLYRAAEISGVPAEGYSSAQAMAALRAVAAEALSPDMGYQWADMSYQEDRAPSPGATFAVAILLVFLVLAAQYESWSLPTCTASCSGTAASRLRRLFRPLARAHTSNSYREQHLCADRPHHADRPRAREKRDPHRRVRQDAARAGERRRDGRHGVGEASGSARS